MHASTFSLFYPLFAALDVLTPNARRRQRSQYVDGLRVGRHDARKLILEKLSSHPSVAPELIDGKPRQSYPTSEIASDSLLPLRSGEHWHAFEGYAEHALCRPCKLLLTNTGINAASGEYEDFGVPPRSSPTSCARTQYAVEKCDQLIRSC